MTAPTPQRSPGAAQRPAPITTVRRWWPAAADAAAIVAFAALGRRSHDGTGSAIADVAEIAAPFLLAATAAWLLPFVHRAPRSVVAGAVVWGSTVVGGMLLRRWMFDRGTAASFVIVATLTLGTLLIGWRAVAQLAARRRGQAG